VTQFRIFAVDKETGQPHEFRRLVILPDIGQILDFRSEIEEKFLITATMMEVLDEAI